MNTTPVHKSWEAESVRRKSIWLEFGTWQLGISNASRFRESLQSSVIFGSQDAVILGSICS